MRPSHYAGGGGRDISHRVVRSPSRERDAGGATERGPSIGSLTPAPLREKTRSKGVTRLRGKGNRGTPFIFKRIIKGRQRELGPWIPECLILMDLQDPMCLSIVKECTKYQIPIIAITDTNTNPLGIEYPIPGNDAEYELYTQLFWKAIIQGKKQETERVAVDQKTQTLEWLEHIVGSPKPPKPPKPVNLPKTYLPLTYEKLPSLSPL